MLFVLSSSALAAPPPRYLCTLRPGPPARVRVYRVEGKRRTQVGPEFSYRRRAKMASAADVDGDGKLDLLVLIYKTTRYDRKPGWRPFVYTLEDGQWFPKWLGSRVGHPLQEAAFVHTPKGVRLLTIERFGRGKSGMTLYHWTGFGFWGEWTGPAGPTMSGLRVSPPVGEGADGVSVKREGRRARYEYRDGGYLPAARKRARKTR